ncbi:MAG: gamma-glutamyl-gamma-aminobutyrate hydrolase family protein [Anaerolineae bacterium]|nr:gamma-glutamyl-gamma-aminobutyrate hydrolase family protein [Phycisphaerae bacterium]
MGRRGTIGERSCPAGAHELGISGSRQERDAPDRRRLAGLVAETRERIDLVKIGRRDRLRRVRPTIGVTGPDRGGDAAWLFTWFNHTLAGARAVRITPHRHATSDIAESLDGLIIGGGADVDPKLYGQELLHIVQAVQAPRLDRPRSLRKQLIDFTFLPLTWLLRKAAACCVEKKDAEKREVTPFSRVSVKKRKVTPFSRKRGHLPFFTPFGADAARDELEMRLLDLAVQRRLPILGICRGEQLINVHFGGSLHQDLKSFYVEDPEVRTILPRKRIRVEPNTRLARVIGTQPRTVNALHQQAIATLGRGLIAAARDRNGIIQAIEHESLPFVIGVQWHPEYLPQHKRQRAIFEALVDHARRREPVAHMQAGPMMRIAG